MPRPKDRNYMLTIWLQDEERDALRDLAKLSGLDVSSYVRMWIRSSAEAAGLFKQRAKKKRGQ
jgi:hypothetical protein